MGEADKAVEAKRGLVDGFRIRCAEVEGGSTLTIVDDFTKESVDIALDHGISGHYVSRVLDQAIRFRGAPEAIRLTRGLNAPDTPWISGPIAMAFSSG